MDNDAAGQDMNHVLALVGEQMQELARVEQQRAALVATGVAADGLVSVSVDAQRVVTEVVIDEDYLDDFEFAELGGHVAEAARAAGEEVGVKAAALLEGLSRRREEIAAASGGLEVPDFGEVLAGLRSATPVDGLGL